jgi:hypothetical protein
MEFNVIPKPIIVSKVTSLGIDEFTSKLSWSVEIKWTLT